jgi:hypothetical protein
MAGSKNVLITPEIFSLLQGASGCSGSFYGCFMVLQESQRLLEGGPGEIGKMFKRALQRSSANCPLVEGYIGPHAPQALGQTRSILDDKKYFADVWWGSKPTVQVGKTK